MKVNADIMWTMGFKTSIQSKTAYINALIESRKVKEIAAGRGGYNILSLQVILIDGN